MGAVSKRVARTGLRMALAAALLGAGLSAAGAGDAPKYKVDGATFKCLQKMTSVKHYFVDNLGSDVAETKAVAEAGRGDFPEGTVLQLIPNEAMIKQQKGYNPGANDWEFFALDTSKDGTKIVTQGAEEVNNFLSRHSAAAQRCHGERSEAIQCGAKRRTRRFWM